MNKHLIAVCALATAAGMASAQSSVTLFGISDVALQWGRGTTADRFAMAPAQYNGTRFGVRGIEDLGAGLKASFWLEAGVNPDDGTFQSTNTNNQTSGQPANGSVPAGSQGLIFNRRSTLSLSGGLGELRLGRDYVPIYWNYTVFAPTGTVGVGNNQIAAARSYPTAVRASNSIGYFLPRNIGGVYGQAMYYLGENPSNAIAGGLGAQDDGRGWGVRLGYAAGPVDVALASGRTEYATGDISNVNLGGSWDLGAAKLMGMWGRDDMPGNLDLSGWVFGASVPVGAGEIRVSYSQSTLEGGTTEPRGRKVAASYVYNLSKRTALYMNLARVRNSGGATFALGRSVTAANAPSSGLDLGIRHAF